MHKEPQSHAQSLLLHDDRHRVEAAGLSVLAQSTSNRVLVKRRSTPPRHANEVDAVTVPLKVGNVVTQVCAVLRPGGESGVAALARA